MIATQVKERPILFSGQMVRAILEGRKSQTRRIIKPQFGKKWGHGVRRGDDLFCVHVDIAEPDGSWKWIRCPFGKPGDQLWVRETWLPLDEDHQIGSCKFAYRSTTSGDGEAARKAFVSCGRKYQWCPSIHMPRCASRITLEITGTGDWALNPWVWAIGFKILKPVG